MNIYLISKEPFPQGMAATNRIKCLAKALLSQNVLTQLVLFGTNPLNMANDGVFEGIPYHFIGSSCKVKNDIFFRLKSCYRHILLLFYLIIRLKKGDVVFEYWYGNYYLRALLIRLAHVKGAAYVSELCELPYGTGKETPSSIKNRKTELEYLFPMFDGVVVISENLRELASQYCNTNCLIVKVPILVDYDLYELEDLSDKASVPYIFHSGTLYEQKDGILGVIEAFGMVTGDLKEPFNFVLTGKIEESPHQDEIKQLIKKYDLADRIMFLGYISEEEIKKRLSYATMVILNKYDNQQNRFCFSTKLAEYLAAGKPVIVTRVGEAVNWLTDGVDSIMVNPGKTKEMADAILKLYNNPELRKEIGNNAKDLCSRSFDYKKYGKLLKETFETIYQKKCKRF